MSKLYDDMILHQAECKSNLYEVKDALRYVRDRMNISSIEIDRILFMKFLSDNDKYELIMGWLDNYKSYKKMVKEYEKTINTYIGIILVYEYMTTGIRGFINNW